MDGGTLTIFDVPDAVMTFPTAISKSGQIVGYYFFAVVPSPSALVLLILGASMFVIGRRAAP